MWSSFSCFQGLALRPNMDRFEPLLLPLPAEHPSPERSKQGKARVEVLLRQRAFKLSGPSGKVFSHRMDLLDKPKREMKDT
mmetsp:Transcript_86458/g.176444  ORF Transcript_86458/g.176444 Transcript_86458/m.176444 type:complete len:81 (-) Transcript_86458:330-572(-)